MKVLHLISQRPDSTGSGIYLQQLINFAHRAGHLNHLICGIGDNEEVNLEGLSADRISTVGFNTRNNPGAIVGMSDVMPYPSRMFRNLSGGEIIHYQRLFQRTIDAAVRGWRPDLIHSHHLWLVSSLAAEITADLPIVCSCHGSDLRQFQQCPSLRAEVAAGCRKLDRILALTRDQKKQIVKLYDIEPDRIQVVGAGYDELLFSDITRPAGPNRPLIILYVGKLSRAKGVVWLLQALQRLDHYSYHLHLVGSGQGKESEHCFAEAEKLGGRVSVHGPLDQKGVAGLLQTSHLFVLPSLFEGLPLVVLEALGCGCQVIATDLPGLREMAEQTDTDNLMLIPTPTVIDANTTEIENEDRFINDLVETLRPFLNGTRQTGGRPANLTNFRWSSVYKRVDRIWRELTSTPCLR